MDEAKNKQCKIFNEIVNHILIKIEEKVNLSSYEVKQAVNKGIHQYHGLVSEELISSRKTGGWHFDSDKNRVTGIKETGNQAYIKFLDVLNLAQDKFSIKIQASRFMFNSSLNLACKRLQEDMNSVRYNTFEDPTFSSHVIQLKKYLHRNIKAVNQEHTRFNESVNQAHAEFKESVNKISFPVQKRENQIPGLVQNPINNLQTGKFISSTFSNQKINDLNANRQLSFYNRFNNMYTASSNITSTTERGFIQHTTLTPSCKISLMTHDEPTTHADYKSENESKARTPEVVSNFTMIPTNNQTVNSISTLNRKQIKSKARKSNEMRTTTENTSVPESGNKFRKIQLNSVSYVGPSLKSTATCSSSASSINNQSIMNTEEESACRMIEQINNPSFFENNNPVESKDIIKCPICFDSVRVMEEENRKLLSTNCGHIFCDRCIKNQQRCPICRRKAIRPFRFVYL